MNKEKNPGFRYHRKIATSYLRKNSTKAEDILWQRVRRRQIENFKFRRQSPIASYIVDFYCPAAKLVIEVDGSIHEHFQEADSIRDRVLSDRGLTVLRFTNDEIINDIEHVLERLSEYLKK